MRISSFLGRLAAGTTKPFVLIMGFVLLAGASVAAIAIVYSNSSTITTTVTPAPVQFLAGDDAGPSTLTTYVSAYTLSTNKTYMTATVKGVPESTLTVDSLFKLQNVDTSMKSVTLTTARVTNTYVSAYTVEIYDASNVLRGTLNMTSTSPSAQFSVPAGSTYYAKLTLTLASGAGADNVALTNGISLSVA